VFASRVTVPAEGEELPSSTQARGTTLRCCHRFAGANSALLSCQRAPEP
jgi:hypothetical protein